MANRNMDEEYPIKRKVILLLVSQFAPLDDIILLWISIAFRKNDKDFPELIW